MEDATPSIVILCQATHHLSNNETHTRTRTYNKQISLNMKTSIISLLVMLERSL